MVLPAVRYGKNEILHYVLWPIGCRSVALQSEACNRFEMFWIDLSGVFRLSPLIYSIAPSSEMSCHNRGHHEQLSGEQETLFSEHWRLAQVRGNSWAGCAGKIVT